MKVNPDRKTKVYEYMYDWEKFNKTLLLEKEDFSSHLNMEDFTDFGYTHRKRLSKIYWIKTLAEHHDLYV